MDINNRYQQNSILPARSNAGGILGYDISLEKKEIEEITREIKQELLVKWKKAYANAQIFPAAIEAMHPGVVDFLLSFSLVSVYDNIAKLAGLDAKGRSILPKIVWQVAQEKSWDKLDQILESKIPLVHSAHVTVANELEKSILNNARAIAEKPFAKKIAANEVAPKKQVKMTLPQALVKYPKLEQQTISTDQLKLRYAANPMRPSIKNWITDFHDSFGGGKHNQMDRGNFLFHSENGKKLTAGERQKVGIILRALDEQMPLLIDEQSETIIFENLNEQAIVNKNDAIAKSQTQPESIVKSAPVIPMEKNEKIESFFSVAGSKPVIGSETFHEEKKQEKETEIENTPQFAEAPKKFISPNNISFSSAQKFAAEKVAIPDEKIAHPAPVAKSFVNQAVQSAMPISPVVEKKQEHVVQQQVYHNVSMDDASKKGINSISQQPASQLKKEETFFIHPQAHVANAVPVAKPAIATAQAFVKKPEAVVAPVAAPFQQPEKPVATATKPAPSLPKEVPAPAPVQATKPAAPIVIQPRKAPIAMSPYHIAPSRRAYEEKKNNDQVRINGNVVDLS